MNNTKEQIPRRRIGEAAQQTQTSLKARISSALSNTNANSSQLAALVDECEQAIYVAENKASALREAVLDPQQFPDRRAAREALNDAVFESNRLMTLRPRLQQRLQVVTAAERHDAWLQSYAELKIERDDAVDMLVESYVAPAERIVAALQKCVEVNAKLQALHEARPSGESLHLDRPEVVCRGELNRNKPSLLEALQLPAWDGGGNLWPPKQPSKASVLIGPEAYDYGERTTGNWWREQAAAAEAQRIRDEQQLKQAAIERDEFYGRR